MAEGNVEIVRRIYDAVARGDNATVLAAYDAEVEVDFSRSPFREVLDCPIFYGAEGLRSFIRERYEAWETVADQLEELIDAGEQVVTVVISRGRGRTSGAEVEQTHYGVWTLQGGKVIRVAWLGTRAEALGAAGLSE
jgi:ketosteroid isomerase-like protein